MRGILETKRKERKRKKRKMKWDCMGNGHTQRFGKMILIFSNTRILTHIRNPILGYYKLLSSFSIFDLDFRLNAIFHFGERRRTGGSFAFGERRVRHIWTFYLTILVFDGAVEAAEAFDARRRKRKRNTQSINQKIKFDVAISGTSLFLGFRSREGVHSWDRPSRSPARVPSPRAHAGRRGPIS